MSRRKRLIAGLETRWVAPSYSGWLLLGLTLFFFAAATNTLTGWLYVISGVMVALLVIAALLPPRILRGIQVDRRPIVPVSAGELIIVELRLHNSTAEAKSLIQVQDWLPRALSVIQSAAIEEIPAHTAYRWRYQVETRQRGIYRWHTVSLRTAAPLGLFWCRRSDSVAAKAVIYPTVLPLSQCPLIDQLGHSPDQQRASQFQPYTALAGQTRTLRPYRWGDALRLVHWRTSARYGELRVRELETFTGAQAIVVCLDSTIAWTPEAFEQAVVAAASLYVYALNRQLQVSLWTAATGQIMGKQAVLEALAGVRSHEKPAQPPNTSLLWLTQNPESLPCLPSGSRWLFWQADRAALRQSDCSGLCIQSEQPLALQLQAWT